MIRRLDAVEQESVEGELGEEYVFFRPLELLEKWRTDPDTLYLLEQQRGSMLPVKFKVIKITHPYERNINVESL